MSARFLLSLAGIVFIAMSFIVLGDTAGKLLTSAGVEPVFVAWTRFAIAALIMLPFCGLRRDEMRIFKDPRVIFRGLLISVGISCILTALKSEPMANVFGAFFIGPPAMGFVAQGVGLGAAFMLVAALLAATALILIPLLSRQIRRS